MDQGGARVHQFLLLRAAALLGDSPSKPWFTPSRLHLHAHHMFFTLHPPIRLIPLLSSPLLRERSYSLPMSDSIALHLHGFPSPTAPCLVIIAFLCFCKRKGFVREIPSAVNKGFFVFSYSNMEQKLQKNVHETMAAFVAGDLYMAQVCSNLYNSSGAIPTRFKFIPPEKNWCIYLLTEIFGRTSLLMGRNMLLKGNFANWADNSQVMGNDKLSIFILA